MVVVSPDGRLGEHQVSWVDVDRAPAPDYHDTASLLEHLDVVAQVNVCQVLDDDVEAGAADSLQHLFLVPLVVVVEDVVSTALGNHVHSVLTPTKKALKWASETVELPFCVFA